MNEVLAARMLGQSQFVEATAKICHEANRALCAALGDNSQQAWEDAPEWQKASARHGVEFHVMNDAPPSASHENWMAEKAAAGWKYGPVKDVEKKEHPCFLPYDQLHAEQKYKDYLFRGIIHALNIDLSPSHGIAEMPQAQG